MFRLILLSAFVAVALGASPKIRPRVPILDGRIVGGTDTDISQVPYQLSLQSFGNHFCGASILSTNKAVTGAHCTDGMLAVSLSVRAGSSIRGSGGQVVNVASICQHPNFDPFTFNNDISVLRLSSDITLGPNAQIVPLAAPGSSVADGTAAIISGWGATFEGGFLSRQLQSAIVKKVNQAECNTAYGGRITASMICFADSGKDSCQGDSGGALCVNGVQIGVISWGYGCARPQYPGVYANVAALRDHVDSC